MTHAEESIHKLLNSLIKVNNLDQVDGWLSLEAKNILTDIGLIKNNEEDIISDSYYDGEAVSFAIRVLKKALEGCSC